MEENNKQENNEENVGLPKFSDLDKNDDGVLSQEEYSGAAPDLPQLQDSGPASVWRSKHGYSLNVDPQAWGLTEEEAFKALSEAEQNKSWDDPQVDADSVLRAAQNRKSGM